MDDFRGQLRIWHIQEIVPKWLTATGQIRCNEEEQAKFASHELQLQATAPARMLYAPTLYLAHRISHVEVCCAQTITIYYSASSKACPESSTCHLLKNGGAPVGLVQACLEAITRTQISMKRINIYDIYADVCIPKHSEVSQLASQLSANGYNLSSAVAAVNTGAHPAIK